VITDLTTYYENMKKPWALLFYRVVWEQLSQITHSRVLDFGSGLGITANHLAENNDVVAIEPDAGMIEMRICENSYQQIMGDIEQLRQQQTNSFDAVVCHNVLEYAKERKEIFAEFCRVLKPNGLMSIVKHNHAGRIMQKVVFENNVEEAISLLDGGAVHVMNFGQVSYYDINDVTEWISSTDVIIDKVLGIRTFWALQQNNERKAEPAWFDKMFEIEMKVSDLVEFKNVSFYNHLMLKKHS
jgi:S-adenosylmethionine-dependent methyltransferase